MTRGQISDATVANVFLKPNDVTRKLTATTTLMRSIVKRPMKVECSVPTRHVIPGMNGFAPMAGSALTKGVAVMDFRTVQIFQTKIAPSASMVYMILPMV